MPLNVIAKSEKLNNSFSLYLKNNKFCLKDWVGIVCKSVNIKTEAVKAD